jgi:hypothetical protein
MDLVWVTSKDNALDEDGGREVPVAMSVRAPFSVRLKKMAGTEPHVNGPVKVATEEWPG